ncbi:MAG: cytochrome b/b6 domain-containing protein [Salinisphaera sp.]|nr:cytochrome b/b6 domain-containing protein [Salinisphaera sp.]
MLCGKLSAGVPAVITSLQGNLLEIHEWVGLIATAIVILHWLWSVADSVDGGSLRALFPWGARGRQNVIEDLMVLRRIRLPLRDHGEPGLAGLIHGLGLLCVSAMAVTGSIIFFLLGPEGFQWPAMITLLDLHAFISAFVWVYWLAHVGIALLHWLAGHEVIRLIFNPRRTGE